MSQLDHGTIVQSDSAQKTRKARPVRPPRELRPLYRLIVDCRDEADQKRMYERLTAEGRACRVLTF